jgi:hypothetical protein
VVSAFELFLVFARMIGYSVFLSDTDLKKLQVSIGFNSTKMGQFITENNRKNSYSAIKDHFVILRFN